jgi:prepilin-type N-terminal cleavage/methylation domain-containing protein
MKNLFGSELGFSLIELVAVIVILGVLYAVASPRFVEVGVFSEDAAKNQVLAGLRYAQQQAMSRGGDIRFCYSGPDYSIKEGGADCASGDLLDTRDGQGRLPGGAVFRDSDHLVFHPLGGLTSSPQCNDAQIQVEIQGKVRTVTVDCYTGFARGS